MRTRRQTRFSGPVDRKRRCSHLSRRKLRLAPGLIRSRQASLRSEAEMTPGGEVNRPLASNAASVCRTDAAPLPSPVTLHLARGHTQIGPKGPAKRPLSAAHASTSSADLEDL